MDILAACKLDFALDWYPARSSMASPAFAAGEVIVAAKGTRSITFDPATTLVTITVTGDSSKGELSCSWLVPVHRVYWMAP